MKRQLFQVLALLLILILTACNNNDDANGSMSDSRPEQDNSESTPNGEFAKIGSGAELVEFPDYEQGILYTTVDRGSIHEDIYVSSKEAIEAAQNGEEFPSATVITLVGFEDGELDQVLVMEKRDGWGSQYSPEERNGEWEYQAFTATGEVRPDNIGRCFSCHANQERDQFVNTYEDLMEFDLDTVAGVESNAAETTFAAAHDWEVSAISAHSKDSNDGNTEGRSVLIEEEEKAHLLEEVLWKLYLTDVKS